jgi:hypothetical protein
MYENIDVSQKRMEIIRRILEERYQGDVIENIVYVKSDTDRYYTAVSWRSGKLGDEEVTYKEIEELEEQEGVK